jgi:hypothetical protein
MLPATLALEVKKQVLHYLGATFQIRHPETERALEALIPGAGPETLETGRLPGRYRSILESCRKLSAINKLLRRSYLDNWVENHRDRRRVD